MLGGVDVVCPGFGSPGRGVFVALEVVSVEPALEELLEKLLEGSAACAVAEKTVAAAGLVGFGAGWVWWLAVASGGGGVAVVVPMCECPPLLSQGGSCRC